MTKKFSIGDLVSIVTLIIPDGPDGKPVANFEYCQEKLIDFFDQHHLDYYLTENNEFAISKLNDFEERLYEGMFVCFGKGKIDGKKRLHPSIRIKIT